MRQLVSNVVANAHIICPCPLLDAPYLFARRFSTLDHLTKGRVAVNVVTSYLSSAARNFGLPEQIEHDERYQRAEEYFDVLYKVSRHSFRKGGRVEREGGDRGKKKG